MLSRRFQSLELPVVGVGSPAGSLVILAVLFALNFGLGDGGAIRVTINKPRAAVDCWPWNGSWNVWPRWPVSTLLTRCVAGRPSVTAEVVPRMFGILGFVRALTVAVFAEFCRGFCGAAAPDPEATDHDVIESNMEDTVGRDQPQV
jgi:hypothetical protein